MEHIGSALRKLAAAHEIDISISKQKVKKVVAAHHSPSRGAD